MRRLLVALLALSALAGLVTGVGAQAPAAPRPQYLPFAEFVNDDSASQISAKQAYNEVVEKYNKALYDYHVTLGQHDQLVDAGNRATTPAEREKARADAAPLRGQARDPAQGRHQPGRRGGPGAAEGQPGRGDPHALTGAPAHAPPHRQIRAETGPFPVS